MNEERELYAWGSNEKGQLGIDAKLTTKEIEFVSFKIDDSAEGGQTMVSKRKSGQNVVEDDESQKEKENEQIEDDMFVTNCFTQVVKKVTKNFSEINFIGNF